MSLADKRCIPCEGGVDPLGAEAIATLRTEVPQWRAGGGTLQRALAFDDFAAAMVFVNRVAELAEAEGHHPDIAIHYNRVEFTLWTHAVGGLSENDFVLAAKIDALAAR